MSWFRWQSDTSHGGRGRRMKEGKGGEGVGLGEEGEEEVGEGEEVVVEGIVTLAVLSNFWH